MVLIFFWNNIFTFVVIISSYCYLPHNTDKHFIQKLQAAAAAQVLREKQEKKQEIVAGDQPKSMAHLRLPKHLQDSARADHEIAMSPAQYSQASSKAPEPAEVASVKSGDAESELSNQVFFETAHKDADDEDVENFEQVYYQGDDYVTYYEVTIYISV